MYNNEARELTNFLTIVQKGIRKHGIKKIVRIIQAIDLQESNMFYNEIFSYILRLVSDEYNFTADEILQPKTRGDITIARNMAIILIKKHLNISDELLAKEFDRVRVVVYKVCAEFKEYDRNDKFYKEFFEVYDRLDEKIAKHIEYLKND
jgi:chromosomal replication initiation ATPase DnaA